MKVNKFILAGVAVLGLGMTACNNDDVRVCQNSIIKKMNL